VLWSGGHDPDLALVQILDENPLSPRITPIFISHETTSELHAIAAGFPEAWRADGTIHEYTVSGSLRNVDLYGPYAWRVAFADKPDYAKGWQGMSGAAVCHISPDDNLYLVGVIEEVPANFTGGLLRAARLSRAFENTEARSALGAPYPSVMSIDAGARIEISFDRDATKSFWYTFDADNNRNIHRHLQNRRLSFSIFSVCPTIFSSYKTRIHGADVFTYNRHSEEWFALESKVESGFPGPSVQRDVLDFQKRKPPFTGCSLEAGDSQKLLIPMIGVFPDAISSEFTEKPHLWDGDEQTSYVCVAVILHVQTRHMLFTCLLPNMTASANEPAYFVGAPEVFDTNDRETFKERATHNLKNVSMLGVSERVMVPGVIV
jgi:hypothetical protein